jgi:fructokinase
MRDTDNAMKTESPVVVGLGELLWDLLPNGSHLGGAPANFAYVASLLGAYSVVVSRVGNDDLGHNAQHILHQHGLDAAYIQTDWQYPTGTVNVNLSKDGLATYDIVENVAWDHLQWSNELQELAMRADAVCFGSLVQRSAESRETVHRFLDNVRADCLKIFDVNLRPPFCSAFVVRQSIRRADVLKLNHEEVPSVLEFSSLPLSADEEAAQSLRKHYSLKAVCITRGANGSIIATATETHTHPGLEVKVADTVGAGDAFTAGLAIQMLAGAPMSSVSRAANGMGAWLASQCGAMPVPLPDEQERLRREYGAAPIA